MRSSRVCVSSMFLFIECKLLHRRTGIKFELFQLFAFQNQKTKNTKKTDNFFLCNTLFDTFKLRKIQPHGTNKIVIVLFAFIDKMISSINRSYQWIFNRLLFDTYEYYKLHTHTHARPMRAIFNRSELKK